MKSMKDGHRRIPFRALFRQGQRSGVQLGLVIGAAALLVSACGGGATSSTPASTNLGQAPQVTLGTSQVPQETSGTSQAPPATFSASGPATGVIEEFGMTQAQLVTNIESVESGIASCMADAGFEYVPIDPVTFRAAQDALGTVPGITDEEFVAQYGFGITTLPPKQDFGVGEDNKRIYDNLAPTEQVAYKRTLLGDDTHATFMVTLEGEDFSSTGGCTRAAVEQVFTPEQLSPTYFNPFDALLQQDPRMVAALEKWSSCMRDGGYDYERQEDAEDELTDQLAAITEGADPSTLTGSAKNALTALQGEERAIALIAVDCEKRFVDPVIVEVERDITGH